MSGVKVNRKSVREAVRSANFPKDVNKRAIERALELDVVRAMRDSGVRKGNVSIELGDFNYDIDESGVVRRRGGKKKTQ